MIIAIRIPSALFRAIPDDIPASSLIRRMLDEATAEPQTLVVAFGARLDFQVPPVDIKRYGIYIVDAEKEAAAALADRFLLSLNQLIQILLEDVLHRAGRWPPAPAPQKEATKPRP